MHKLQSDRDLLIRAVKSFKESFLQSEHHSLLKYHIAAVHIGIIVLQYRRGSQTFSKGRDRVFIRVSYTKLQVT